MAKVQLVDLAAISGHHVAGTSYHWHHGWIPRDFATAERWKKPGFEGKVFHHIEPEEFNGHGGMPKHIASTKFGGKDFADDKPQMAYKNSKALSGHTFKAKNGSNIKVAKVSISKTHVQDATGTKHRIADLKPVNQHSEAALENFKKVKYSAAIKTYAIKSSFKTPKKPSSLPQHFAAKPKEKVPSWSKIPIGKTYSASPVIHAEPTFPHTYSLPAPNLHTPMTRDEKRHIVAYTGSAYMDINKALRAGHGENSPAVKHMDAALKKATPLPADTILHRGFSVQALAQLQPGDAFVERGFVSTTRRAGMGMAQRSTRMHIESNTGVNGLDVNGISLHSSEQEVILPRNTKFTVLRRVEHGSHAHIYVHAEPASPEDLTL